MTDPRPDWAALYPHRWDREVQELHATGWSFRVLRHDETVLVEIDWPLAHSTGRDALAAHGDLGSDGHLGEPERSTVCLEVWFPAEYPFFPPRVYDRSNQLELSRHRNTFGALCLVEDADWHPDTTVAALLTRQLPGLLVAGEGAGPVPGLEVPAPEPVDHLVLHAAGQQALIMPTDPIPDGVDEGALVVRHAVLPGGVLGAGLVEHILGDGIDIPGPAPALERIFDLVVFGLWARDPDFNPADSPEQTWARVAEQIQPLQIDLADPDGAAEPEGDRRRSVDVPPTEIEALCLLVPSEDTYRHDGETWVAMLRATGDDGTASYHHIPVQRLGPAAYASRTPESQLLAGRHVVLVGLGALGGQIAVDLVRTGVGHLDLVDGDHVEVATATRQHAPLYAAGRSKVETLLGHLKVIRPDVHLVGLDLHIGQPTDLDAVRRKRRTLARMVRDADLVIDATAAPAVTRYLAAVRQAHGRPFLHVSATAGAWGGCVFLTTPATGCWSCLQHHRHDHAVPVPAADPAGLVAPVGCAEPTFTGTSPDLATIAHHASRVAIDHLADGDGLGGDLYVAHLRDPRGDRRPVAWQSTPVPVHPGCPLHAPQGISTTTGASTAQDAAARTIPDQPQEREADGHSPPRAPIPRTQQRKSTNAPAQPLPSSRRRHRIPGAGDTTRAPRR